MPALKAGRLVRPGATIRDIVTLGLPPLACAYPFVSSA